MGYVQGLLWFDSKDSLESRLHRAIAYYENKYQCQPDVALVNANDYARSDKPERVNGIEVIPSANMSTSHCLIGVVSETHMKTL